MNVYSPLSWKPSAKTLSHNEFKKPFSKTRKRLQGFIKLFEMILIAITMTFITSKVIFPLSSTIVLTTLPLLIFHCALYRQILFLSIAVIAGLWIETIHGTTPFFHLFFGLFCLVMTHQKWQISQKPFWVQWTLCLLVLMIYYFFSLSTELHMGLLMPWITSSVITGLFYPLLCALRPFSKFETVIEEAEDE